MALRDPAGAEYCALLAADTTSAASNGGANLRVSVAYAAIPHGDMAMGRRGDVQVVGDHDEGGAVALLDLREQLQDFRRVDAVEIAGGLVGEEHCGIVDEAARDSDALSLAGGELVGVLMKARLEAEFDEQGSGSFFTVVPMASGAQHRHLHVFERVERGEQMEGLEDEAGPARAIGIDVNGGDAILRFADRLAAKQDRAFRREIESAEQMQQRRFAAAARSGNGEEIAGAMPRLTPRSASMAPFS